MTALHLDHSRVLLRCILFHHTDKIEMHIQEARQETKMVGTTVYAKKVQKDNQICATADTAKK